MKRGPKEASQMRRPGATARSLSAQKAWRTRRRLGAFTKARAAEAASKEALRGYGLAQGWRIAFFEGATGAPRTGIIDAVAFQLGRRDPDRLDVCLIQLKGGHAGVSGSAQTGGGRGFDPV